MTHLDFLIKYANFSDQDIKEHSDEFLRKFATELKEKMLNDKFISQETKDEIAKYEF